MTLAIFSFESSQVRTLGTAESPLFVAIDIAVALGYQNAKDALSRHVDPEDLTKQEIETKGGRQTVNCVNESGLYALIFGSKLESAKRFKRWVTNEVLPAIRKQGRYECPAQAQLPPPTLSEQQAYAIMSEVAKRAKNCGAHYQTIYRALKARYQVTRYTNIPSAQFNDAIEFIRNVNLAVPETQPSSKAVTPTKKKTYVVTENFIERQRTFVYHLRYLFREEIDRLIEVMRLMDSPHAAALYDAIHDLNLVGVEEDLARLGFPVQELNTYKHWSSRHIK